VAELKALAMATLQIERQATNLIAWITVLTGASQMVMPATLLPLLAVQSTPAAAQLFATVGMFMVLFGGALLHAQRATQALPLVLWWAALQKLGAAALVAWGVGHDVFAPLALAVAAFDAASGLLFLDLRRRGG
jgi:hypothetical protein